MSQTADGTLFTLKAGKGGTPFRVEAVSSPAALARGLSGRPPLPPNYGMLFLFPTLERRGMWMPDMRFALDIVWLDEQFTVSHVNQNAPPCPSRAQCPNYSSVDLAKYAIELPAGGAAALGLRPGVRVYVLS